MSGVFCVAMPSSRMKYPAPRTSIFAANMVATSQPLADQAGLRILQHGGNAIDAAIAMAITLTVVEPTSNGIGSDAFALFWKSGRLHGMNGSGRSPRAFSRELLPDQDRMPVRGWPTVTVPGAVALWRDLHRAHGRFKFEALFEPAIKYAEGGFPVSPQTADDWHRAFKTLSAFDEWRATFAPNGRAPRAGELFVAPRHADTLRRIAETEGESFYTGELAGRIVAASRGAGWVLDHADLAEHATVDAAPLGMPYRNGCTLWELPPNGQGIAALIALGIVRRFDLNEHGPDDADTLHVQIEAMKLAFAEAHRSIADPDWMTEDPHALIADAHLDELAAKVDRNRAQDFGHGPPKPGGTVLLTAADAEGTMVTFIQSNYMGFGSGIVIPDTGIALQNRGACFTLEAGHPNEAAGGKRPYQTIIPGFITRNEAATDDRREEVAGDRSEEVAGDQQPHLAFGVMGGFMQPQGHLQMAVRTIDFDQDPQAALDAPRWQVFEGKRLTIEAGFPSGAYEELQQRGHAAEVVHERNVSHGGGQAIQRLANGCYLGASDHRRDGQAVGY
ncbi:MAG: gamma-glutamyltransferase family protein [Phycisphaerales bacterium]|nr:MAG: gamma-glutamyltransferase family protein [Phycisphaerales bacterium]